MEILYLLVGILAGILGSVIIASAGWWLYYRNRYNRWILFYLVSDKGWDWIIFTSRTKALEELRRRKRCSQVTLSEIWRACRVEVDSTKN